MRKPSNRFGTMNLKQLSTKLGLSQTTVSRALNGFPEVSQKTRTRVQRAAQEHGYAPSQAARGLATGKVNAIGHIIPLGKHQMINPHFADFMAGAGRAYADHGTDIVMRICRPEEEMGVFEAMFRSNRVDGFVLQGPLVSDPRIDLLHDLGVPFVVHGRSTNATTPYSFLDVDNAGSFERATNFLLDTGHRDIALLNGMETMDFAFQRRNGFCTAMQNSNVPIRPELLFQADMTESYGYEITKNILALDAPPTAIISASKLVALGAMRAIAEEGLTPSKEISVITFDDDFGFLGTHSPVPQITCLRSSLYNAGVQVANLAVAACEPGAQIKTVVLEPEFVVGRSTGMKI